MDALKRYQAPFLVALLLPILTGCQISYYLHSAKGQFDILNKRVPIEKALKKNDLAEAERKKLLLALDVQKFAGDVLHLNAKKNYTTFVKLDRPSVSYVVSASAKWELKHNLWSFPFVGSVPYKGYFDEEKAKAEEDNLKKQDLDTYRRGVSAYSTLGWFSDPLLSSMLGYSEHELVNTLIHETTHATLYIKSSADFNERMATFVGNKGMEIFYHQREGLESPTLALAKKENEDDRAFSVFISGEIKNLEAWYKTNPEKNEEARLAKIAEIQKRFVKELQPQLKSGSYKKFPDIQLNNARLLIYKTYLQDLSDFERLYELSGQNMETFLSHCRSLEDHKKPEQGLKELIARIEKK